MVRTFIKLLLLHSPHDVACAHGFCLFLNLLLVALGRDGNDDHLVTELGDAVGHVLVAYFQTTGHNVVHTIVLGINGNLGIDGLVVLADPF